MGANSKFHKVIGAAEIVVGILIDYLSDGSASTWGNAFILAGLATFEGMPGMPTPTPAAFKFTSNSAISPMQIVYGKVKTTGPLLIMDSGDGGGSAADTKYMAVALSLTLKTGSTSALRCEGLYSGTTADGYYIDNNNIPAVCVNSTTGVISGTGGGTGGNNTNYDGIVKLFLHNGDQTVVDSNLSAGLSSWPSTSVGYGVCYLVAVIDADPSSDAVQAAFPNGLPSNISAVLKGQRVYDPRLDSTAGGSGSQRKATPSTWTYSQNPALCLRDYLVRPITEGGAGIDYTRIPDDFLTAAANACDATITVPNNVGGTTTQPAFQCGIGLNTADSVPTNIQKLLDSMAGWIIETAGELRIFAGSYTAPVTTLDESWLCGFPTFQTTAEQDARWNTVSTTFTDSDSAYTEIQTPAYAAPGAVTADGGIAITRTLNTPAAPNQYGAQYLTMISANQSREQAMLTIPCNLKALDVDCGEVISVTIAEYGLSAATYRIINWQRKSDSSVLLTLQKANSSTYAPGTFTETAGLGHPALHDVTPPTPTGLTATAHADGITLNWDDVPANVYTKFEVFRAPDVSGSPGTFTLIATPRSSQYNNTVTTRTKYWYKVRTVNYRGRRSAFTSNVSATSVAVTDVVGGIGGNLMPPKYSIFTTSAAALPGFGSHLSWSTGKATSTKIYSYLALQLTSTSSSVAQKLALIASLANTNMALSNKKYGVQVWIDNIDSDANGHNINFIFKNAGATDACTAVAATLAKGTANNGVYSAILDLTAAADTNVYLEVDWNAAVTSGNRIDIQGFGVFEMQGTSTVTPDFVPSAAPSQDDLAAGVVNSAVMVEAVNSSGAIDLSVADTSSGNGAGIENFDTANIGDTAGLGQTADATLTTNLPATVADAVALGMLTDAQTTLPLASAVRMVLRNDGGAFYQDAQYSGGECDGGVYAGTSYMSADQVATGSMADCGNHIVIPNPGQAVTVMATAVTYFVENSSATANIGSNQVLISFDGGSSWTTSGMIGTAWPVAAGVNDGTAAICKMSLSGTPTGNIIIKSQIQQVNGSNTLTAQKARSCLEYIVLASTNASIVGTTNLAASIPGTASMSCSSTYPTTTCTASKNLTVSASGGDPPYVFSNVKTAGTGTITSGASAQTFTVSDTETATTGGATHTTTVQSTVTDAQTYTMSTGATESGSTVTGTLTASALMAVGTLFDMASVVPAGYNGTGLVALSGTTGTTLKYTAGTSGMGATTHTGTVSNVRVVTSTCVVTGTFTLGYPAISVSIATTGGSCHDYAGSGSCTAGILFTTNATGGDGSYSYSNVKTSGSGTITSGASSKNWDASDTGAVPFSVTGTYKSTVTDGHSNSGNKSKTVTFTGS